MGVGASILRTDRLTLDLMLVDINGMVMSANKAVKSDRTYYKII
jgi:hypothetical protein